VLAKELCGSAAADARGTRRPADYPGPRGRLAIDAALKLDPRRWAAMPKADGVCARVRLDQRGRIASVLSRNGRALPEARDMLGIVAGPPDGVLWGELDAHTEAGNRIATERGWRNLSLFDVSRYAGRDVAGLSFGERYGLLHRAQAELECDGRARKAAALEGRGGRQFSASGQFARPVPRDLRRLPILPLARGPGALEQLWAEHVERAGGEGLVAVRLDAPLGKRGAKRKIKATDTLDCVVLACAGGAATLSWRGYAFAVSARGRWSALRAGQVVSVQHDGWYESGVQPRFARLVRERPDLSPS
jgi:hypothetical protein